jgi:hypothetical protein
MTETNDTTNKILKFFFDRRILAWRQNNGVIPLAKGKGYKSAMRKGLPDIFAILPPNGRIVPCEVKTGKDRLSAVQEAFLDCCDEAGATPLVVKDYEDFLNQINVHYGIR